MATIMVPCAVKMPFYNYATQNIIYEAFDMGIVGDDSSIVSNLHNELCKLAWENQSNPDWQIVGDNSHTSSLSGQQGTGSIQCDAGPILRAVIQLNLQNQADINKWYGSSDFGVYGVCGFGNSAQVNGPMWFLNKEKEAFQLPFSQEDWFYYSLKPGVSIDGILVPICQIPYLQYAVGKTISESPTYVEFPYPPSLGARIGRIY